MKKRLLLNTLLLLLVLSAVTPPLADSPATDCGRFFGQHHAEHARAGELGKDHNPGIHQGFSGFLEHHEHECP